MGLDLYHLKATLTPSQPEEAHTFREDDLDGYALDVLGFRRFLQIIPDTDYPARIRAVKDERTLDLLRAHDPWLFKEGVEILVGDPSALPKRIVEFERDRGLDGGTRSVCPETRWIDRSGCHISHGHGWDRPLDEGLWEPTESVLKELQRRPPGEHSPVQIISINYPVPAPFRGLYAEEVGYQRKGMANAFYSRHRRLAPSARFADVRHTYFFVGWEHAPEWNLELRRNFIEQFVVPFEPGRSLFYASF